MRARARVQKVLHQQQHHLPSTPPLLLLLLLSPTLVLSVSHTKEKKEKEKEEEEEKREVAPFSKKKKPLVNGLFFSFSSFPYFAAIILQHRVTKNIANQFSLVLLIFLHDFCLAKKTLGNSLYCRALCAPFLPSAPVGTASRLKVKEEKRKKRRPRELARGKEEKGAQRERRREGGSRKNEAS